MFRQSQQRAIEPKAVASFLLLDPTHSVRYCLARAGNLTNSNTSPTFSATSQQFVLLSAAFRLVRSRR